MKISLHSWQRLVAIISVVLAGCTAGSINSLEQDLYRTQTVTENITIIAETMAAEINADKAPTPSPDEGFSVWYSPALPQGLKQEIALPSQAWEINDVATASMWMDFVQPGIENNGALNPVIWVYVLAAPFPSAVDEVNLDSILNVWRGEEESNFTGKLLLTSSTRIAFENLWGTPAEKNIQIVEADEMLETAWQERNTWALIPFDELSPRWKVLRVDGQSPIERDLNVSVYPLVVTFGWMGEGDVWDGLMNGTNGLAIDYPATNRDEELMTTLLLTGTTAMVRSTALKMEEEGITYPARDIHSWLVEADYVHVSNEVPFYSDCPPAVPLRREARFCSDPRYIELLGYAGIDIVELTGNHLLDWGVEAIEETLEIYRKNNILFYGGGENLEKAREPMLIEHNGNHIALMGCNAMGPESNWATDYQPGSASCDMDWLEGEVKRLKEEGYLPVVTFQHFEVCDFKPQSTQRKDFERMAAAGAIIVSGSQSHCPQGMAFIGDNFIHYGLGNLWFDQMDYITSREFLDRHVFYNGKYIGTQLLTAVIEDYSRPRPMTSDERETLLTEAFEASGW